MNLNLGQVNEKDPEQSAELAHKLRYNGTITACLRRTPSRPIRI